MRDLFRSELLRRGITRERVAELTGCAPITAGWYVSNPHIMSAHFKLLMEAAVFEYELPVWSSGKLLAARKDALERIGIDPCLIRSAIELRTLAAKVGVKTSLNRRPVAFVLDEIFAALAAQPNLRLVKPTTTDPTV